MELPPRMRERSKAFTAAVLVEGAAILAGQTTQDEAVDRLADRFFPHIAGGERDPQPARLPGTAS